MNLWSLPQTETETFNYFQNVGLIPKLKKCKNNHTMILDVTEYRWRCRKNKYRNEISVRNNTWFAGTHIYFLKIVRFIYFLTYEVNSVSWCKRELEFSSHTCVDFNNYM